MTLSISCNKNHVSNPPNPTPGFPDIIGKWTIVTVTTIAYDSTGAALPGRSHVYTSPPNNFFTFNLDGTWTESLLPDSLADAGLGGTYTTSDSIFILKNPAALSSETCRIDTLTPSLFVFSHSRGADFDGTIPGYLEYVFRMTK